MTTTQEPRLEVPRWRISLNWPLGNDGKPIARTVAAWTPESAWAKFCRQYFGALKPARSEYTISREG